MYAGVYMGKLPIEEGGVMSKIRTVSREGWIKCEDEYPEQEQTVLVYDEGGYIFICHHKHGFWRDFRVGNSHHEITHWQPLPEPPQESNDDKS